MPGLPRSAQLRAAVLEHFCKTPETLIEHVLRAATACEGCGQGTERPVFSVGSCCGLLLCAACVGTRHGPGAQCKQVEVQALTGLVGIFETIRDTTFECDRMEHMSAAVRLLACMHCKGRLPFGAGLTLCGCVHCNDCGWASRFCLPPGHTGALLRCAAAERLLALVQQACHQSSFTAHECTVNEWRLRHGGALGAPVSINGVRMHADLTHPLAVVECKNGADIVYGNRTRKNWDQQVGQYCNHLCTNTIMLLLVTRYSNNQVSVAAKRLCDGPTPCVSVAARDGRWWAGSFPEHIECMLAERFRGGPRLQLSETAFCLMTMLEQSPMVDYYYCSRAMHALLQAFAQTDGHWTPSCLAKMRA